MQASERAKNIEEKHYQGELATKQINFFNDSLA